MSELFVVAIGCMGAGIVLGHNLAWNRSAKDVQIVAKITAAAEDIRFNRKFLGESTIAYVKINLNFSGAGGDMYALMCAAEDAHLATISTTKHTQGEG